MHVRDQDLEMYLLDRLENGNAPRFEAHLSECRECATRLSSVTFFDQLLELSRKRTALGDGERRREPRISTEASGVLQTINPFSSDRFDIMVLDVSRSGMKVGIPVFMQPGTMVKVRVKDAIAFGDVRYCKMAGVDFCQAGIQLYEALQI